MEPSRRPASLQSERFWSAVRMQSELMAVVTNVAITGESGYGAAPDNPHATITHPKTSYDSDTRYRILSSRVHEHLNGCLADQLMDIQQGMGVEASTPQLHVEDMPQADRMSVDNDAANLHAFANEFDTGWPTSGNESALVEDLHTRRLQLNGFQSFHNQIFNECKFDTVFSSFENLGKMLIQDSHINGASKSERLIALNVNFLFQVQKLTFIRIVAQSAPSN